MNELIKRDIKKVARTRPDEMFGPNALCSKLPEHIAT